MMVPKLSEEEKRRARCALELARLARDSIDFSIRQLEKELEGTAEWVVGLAKGKLDEASDLADAAATARGEGKASFVVT